MKLACHRLKLPKPRAQINPLNYISCRVVTLVHEADRAVCQEHLAVLSCYRGIPVFSLVSGRLSLAEWSFSSFSPWKTPIHPSKFSSYTLLRSAQNSEMQVLKEREWGMDQRERKSRGGMTRTRGCTGQPGGLGHNIPGSRISQWLLLRKRKVIGGSSASPGNEPAGRHKTKDQFIEAGTEPRCCVLSEADLGLPSCSPPPNKQNHRDRGQGGPRWTGARILSPMQARDWEGN